MLLDWQFAEKEKNRYICNAMPKRREKTKDVPCSWILTAGSPLREVALPVFWRSASAPLVSKRWLLICCAKAALLPCKCRGVGTRSHVQGSQIHSGSSVHQICIPGLSHWLSHRLLGEAGLASGHWRAVLGLHWSGPDILVIHWALHTLFISRVLCGTVLPNFH